MDAPPIDSTDTENAQGHPLGAAPCYASHSQMLGQIAMEVSDWCITDDCTTLDAVKLVVADARKFRGIVERIEIENKYLA